MGNYDIQGLDELVNRTILQGPYIDKRRLKNSREVDKLANLPGPYIDKSRLENSLTTPQEITLLRTILQGPYIDKRRLKNSLVTKQLLTNYAIEELRFT